MTVAVHHRYAARAITGLLARLERVRRNRQRWQRRLVLLAIVAVVAGCGWSLENLELRWSDVRWAPLLTIAAVVVPLSIAYSALNMMLMGHAAKVPMGFRQGVKVSVFAQLAEILPIPGGALVRGAALVRAGSSTARSAELVIAFSLLWISCGAAGAGIALAELGWPAHTLTAGGGASALAICGWLAARFGVHVAVTAAALRVLGVALVAWRFVLAFAVIGVAMPWVDSPTFAFAVILGSAASLIPAGLGVSEGLSALIAQPAGVAPAAAFLAAALSRLLGLAVNIVLALGYALAVKTTHPEPAHG
jgi:hypothetical protein